MCVEQGMGGSHWSGWATVGVGGPFHLMGAPGDMIMRMMAQNEVSEELQEAIDRNVKKILDEAYEMAKVCAVVA